MRRAPRNEYTALCESPSSVSSPMLVAKLSRALGRASGKIETKLWLDTSTIVARHDKETVRRLRSFAFRHLSPTIVLALATTAAMSFLPNNSEIRSIQRTAALFSGTSVESVMMDARLERNARHPACDASRSSSSSSRRCLNDRSACWQT